MGQAIQKHSQLTKKKSNHKVKRERIAAFPPLHLRLRPITFSFRKRGKKDDGEWGGGLEMMSMGCGCSCNEIMWNVNDKLKLFNNSMESKEIVWEKPPNSQVNNIRGGPSWK